MKTLQENQSLNLEYQRNKELRELKEQLQQKENIINELEEWLKGGGVIQFDLEHQMLAVKDILNKLQELKGVDKK